MKENIDEDKSRTVTELIIEKGVVPLDEEASSEFNEDDYFHTDENQFTALLGLP